jgi:hypothetical protein
LKNLRLEGPFLKFAFLARKAVSSLFIFVKIMAIESRIVEGTLQTLKHIESQIDAQLQELNALEDDDLRKLKIQRLKAIQKQAKQMEEWRIQGHGLYQEIPDQKQWFEEVKNNQRVVCHFFRPTSECCEILDAHLTQLARKHLETRFIKINAEKAPFLATRLSIEILPTIILTKDNFTEDRIEGFDELGGTMHFDTVVLEKRIARKGIIDLDLEKLEREVAAKNKKEERDARIEDDDDDW